MVKYRRNIADAVGLNVRRMSCMLLLHGACVLHALYLVFHVSLQQDTDAMTATRVALTVKDFNYYIGHAYVSLSRLHINMMAAPPRTIRLTAPRRTEMRRMMTQMRNDPPPRSEVPSGYIVDISRDDDIGEASGERRSTRAIVNRATPLGGGGGAEGGGNGRESNGASRGERRSNGSRFESLFPPGLGFAVSFLKKQLYDQADNRFCGQV